MLQPELLPKNLHDMIQWDLQQAHVETYVLLNLNSSEKSGSSALMKENIINSGEFERTIIKDKNNSRECIYKLVYDKKKERIIGIVRVFVESATRCQLRYYFTMMIPFEEVTAQLKLLELIIELIVIIFLKKFNKAEKTKNQIIIEDIKETLHLPESLKLQDTIRKEQKSLKNVKNIIFLKKI